MSLALVLGYRIEEARGLRRLAVRVLQVAPATLMRRVARPVDRLVLRLSGGSITATAALTGLPVLWVSTVGARSGHTHRVPLLAIPWDGDLHLFGTAFGTERMPSWAHNLIANPTVRVDHRDRTARVTAIEVPADQQEPLWDAAARLYPGFSRYRVTAAHRRIPIVRLEVE